MQYNTRCERYINCHIIFKHIINKMHYHFKLSEIIYLTNNNKKSKTICIVRPLVGNSYWSTEASLLSHIQNWCRQVILCKAFSLSMENFSFKWAHQCSLFALAADALYSFKTASSWFHPFKWHKICCVKTWCLFFSSRNPWRRCKYQWRCLPLPPRWVDQRDERFIDLPGSSDFIYLLEH